MLDATGSMQDIGGKRKGRDLVVRKMEEFRKMLKENNVIDQPLTFVTFNEKAKWTSYDSIKDWPTLTRRNYNPGYQTNLFDSMGCVLSKYKSINRDQQVSFYLISDGVHQLTRKKQRQVTYTEGDIEDMIEELRSEEGWDFHFYGASTTEDKKR